MRRRVTSLSILAFLGLGTIAFAQVTGVVNDADGFGAADTEVRVKGTDKVVYTDIDGNFDIDAKIGDTLIINGKEHKVTSNDLGTIGAPVSDKIELEETLITVAFGKQRKEVL